MTRTDRSQVTKVWTWIGALAVVVLLGCLDDGETKTGEDESRHGPKAVKLAGSDGARKDRFGFAVSVSGATIVVGAPEHDGGLADAGAAYVFEAGTEVVKLTADDRQAQARFGWSVGISSETIVVGAFQDGGRGAAYVFERVDGIWQQTAKLRARDGARGDRFGYFVGTTGETAVVGAIWDDDNGPDTGSAYVFEKRGRGWKQTAKLIGDGGSDKSFGRRLSLSGDTLVVGSGSDLRGVDAGTAYVFEKVGGRWTKAATLAPADVGAGDEFGWSVAVSGATAVVSAELDDDHGDDAGSAYVFEKSDGTWTQVAKLLAVEGAAGDQFGQSVGISGDTIVVGAQFGEGRPGARSGLAYTFERRSGVWTQAGTLLPPDGAGGDEFGFSSSIDGTAVVIGAPRHDHPAVDSGSAYIFDLSLRDSAVARVSAPPPATTSAQTEHRVDVGDGVHIFYTLHGDDGPVVLVPVGRIVGDLQPLVDAGYRVAVMDARGRGLSTTVTEGIPHSLETDLSDIDAVRQDIGVERVHLIGISYYGALVGVYAARYPDHVERVVMLGPMAPTAEIFAERTVADHSQSPAYLEVDRMRREGLHESDPPAFCRAYYTAHAIELYSDPSRFDPSAMSSCDLENEWPDNIQRWANNLFATIGPWDFTEDAATIEAPVLLVQGRQDQITAPRGASVWSEAMASQASVVWLDDCGHVPLKEHPQETMERILAFLSE